MNTPKSTRPSQLTPSPTNSTPVLAHHFSWLDQGIETVLLLSIAVTPLLFSPLSHELFEFPKMVWVYFLAILGLGLLFGKSLTQSKLTIAVHPLSRPLVIYSLVLVVSTILSIDLYTSIMGYYSRFHGGLASLAAYVVLFYLALIYLLPPDSRRQRTAKLVWSWVMSSIVISAWAVAEHFGFSPSCWLLRGELNADCWVQDVQARVFATFGQPNWLAAYLLTSIPLSLGLLVVSAQKYLQFVAWLGLTLGYAALWYTYSRSGWIGLVAAGVTLLPWAWRIPYRRLWPWLGLVVVVCGLVSLSSIQMASQRTSTALESGNLDSSTGQIRLLVWQGSLETALAYPVFGSGPETFPYSFLAHRPAGLNQTTEWNFLYNKAHNEVLQYAVTTGVVGLVAWLLLYVKLGHLAWQQRILSLHPRQLTTEGMVPASLLAGIVGTFTAQLLGFSVVVTGLYFWLAVAIVIAPTTKLRQAALSPMWRSTLGVIGSLTIVGLGLGLSCYFFAEVIANQAHTSLRTNPWRAEQQLTIATRLNPFESSYQQQLALADAYLAQVTTTTATATYYARQADKEAQGAYRLNPYHILNLKGITTVYQQLSNVDQKYLDSAIKMAQTTVELDLTDANAQHTLAQLYLQAKDYELALATFNRVIDLRPQAADSYIARAIYYRQTNQPELARQDLQLAQTLEPTNPEVIENLQQLH